MTAGAGGAVGRTRIRVRYGETDQQGVAYHAEYLVWMDVARTTLLRELGFPYSRLEAEGLVFAVSEASCRYVGAARYEEEVEVETRVRKLQSRAVVFDYVLTVGERIVATGATTLVALDARRRPRRIPEPVARALAGDSA